MKAKEYAEQFNNDPSVETLTRIAVQFLVEYKQLMEQRKAKTDSAILAIFEEQNRKWKAFARLVDGIKPDGFLALVKSELPQVYEVWQKKD